MVTDAVAESRSLIEGWYRAGLAAVEPEAAVRRHLVRRDRTLAVGDRRVVVGGRLIVVGVGKAAVGMARGALGACGDLITAGLVVTKDGHAAGPAVGPIRVAEAAHPVPDARGERATRAMLALLGELGPDDLVLALISGGGSALLEAPVAPLTLADLAATTELLLRAGAPIQDLNAVRTPLSLVKGGGLRRAAGRGTVVTLILSDVLGNDPRVIASGPTVAGDDPRSAARNGRAVLEHYGLWERVPDAVRDALIDLGGREVGDEAATAEWDVIAIVGVNASAVEAAAEAARGDGYRCRVVWRDKAGEAAALGRAWVEACAAAGDDVDVLLGGGEATVSVRGDGVGGRNTEFTLAAALALEERGDAEWVVASLATDGQDALTGVAGAIADGRTPARARAAGVDPGEALGRNDSLRVFEAAGGVVRPGPTGTNVNDIYLAVRISAVRGDSRRVQPDR